MVCCGNSLVQSERIHRYQVLLCVMVIERIQNKVGSAAILWFNGEFTGPERFLPTVKIPERSVNNELNYLIKSSISESVIIILCGEDGRRNTKKLCKCT